jgi:predicted RNA-binding protein YlxR (DUF448 family)
VPSGVGEGQDVQVDEGDEIPLEPERGPNRRCIASGQIKPKDELVRYVVDPANRIIPDVAGNLPGRGLWVSADRDTLALAVKKNAFARAARAKVTVPPDLADQTERLLAARALELLGLARRAGSLVLGFDGVDIALSGSKRMAVLIAAADGAPDGRRKLAAKRKKAILIDCFTSGEMGLALRRENVIHAALRPSGLSDRFVVEVARLLGFRAGTIPIPASGDTVAAGMRDAEPSVMAGPIGTEPADLAGNE